MITLFTSQDMNLLVVFTEYMKCKLMFSQKKMYLLCMVIYGLAVVRVQHIITTAIKNIIHKYTYRCYL